MRGSALGGLWKNNLENLIKHIKGSFGTFFEEWRVRPKISERIFHGEFWRSVPLGDGMKKYLAKKRYGGSGLGGRI